jgi:hypothetical protein
MGLFSKNKDKSKDLPKDANLPPMAPAPNGGEPQIPPTLSQVNDKQKQTSPQISQPIESSMPQLPNLNSSKLSAPPMPGGNHDEHPLNDIKNDIKPPQMPTQEPQNNFDTPEIEEPKLEENQDDDIFDMFSMDEHTENDEDTKEEINKVLDNHNTSESLEFENNNDKTDTKFLTTNQFKTMLEIVDQVKSRVKESHNSHTRLMDIKSEEDIEYENLRKSFQFLEEKLYEMDSAVFEK